MHHLIRYLALAVLLLATATAGAKELSRKQRQQLEEIQTAYGATIRWGSMEDALAYIDPEVRRAQPMTEFEARRYAQIRISAYRERATSPLPDGTYERRVEVGVINVNTQAERTVGVVERWRWDPQAKRWWQIAGLPDFWQGQ